LDMYKKRRLMYEYKSHCLKFATCPAESWLYRVYTQSTSAPGQCKRCKKTSMVEPSLYCGTGCLRRAGSPFFFSFKGAQAQAYSA
jgi:hypothetical protein